MQESQVRNHIRKLYGDRVFWHEQSKGSSHGFPDTSIEFNSILVPVELKVANITNLTLNDEPHTIFRPSQFAVFHQFRTLNITAFAIFGHKGPPLKPTHPAFAFCKTADILEAHSSGKRSKLVSAEAGLSFT